MKVFSSMILVAFSLSMLPLSMVNAVNQTEESTQKVAIVNFKQCVDQSKLGKEEQSNFEAMKGYIEKSLEEKEKVLTELSNKLSDADYLDSLSPETETELKRKFRQQSQDFSQLQGQYYQTLSQLNMKIVQKLQEAVMEASKAVAEEKNLDYVLNDDSVFYYHKRNDISDAVIAKMDHIFEEALKSLNEVKPGE